MKLLSWAVFLYFIDEFVLAVKKAKAVKNVIEIASNDPVNKIERDTVRGLPQHLGHS